MRKHVTKYLVLMTCAALGAMGQTKIDLKTQSRSVDFSAASSTKPFSTGNVLPATCSSGETFLLLSAHPGANIYVCIAANIWTPQNSVTPHSGTTDNGKILTIQDGEPTWSPVSGDVSGGVHSATVTGIQGRSVAPEPPADGQVITWDALTGQWKPKQPASGDMEVMLDGITTGRFRTHNYLTGSGMLSSVAETGATIHIQHSVNSAVVPTYAAIQSNSALYLPAFAESADVYSGCPEQPITAYHSGMVLWSNVDTANTGAAATLNVCSLGARAILRADGVSHPAAGSISPDLGPIPITFDASLNSGAGAWRLPPGSLPVWGAITGNLSDQADLSAALATLSSSVSGVSASVTSVSDQVGAVSSEMTSLTQSLDAVSAEVTSLASSVSTVASSVDAVSSEVTSLASSLNTVSSSVDAVTSDVNSLASSVGSVSSTVDTVTSQVTSLQSSMASISSSVTSMESSLNGKADAAHSHTVQVWEQWYISGVFQGYATGSGWHINDSYGVAIVNQGTNVDPRYSFMTFADAGGTASHSVFLPPNWNGGPVTLRLLWTYSTNAGGNIVYRVRSRGLQQGSTSLSGTGAIMLWTGTETWNEVVVPPATAYINQYTTLEFTPDASCTAGSVCFIQINRRNDDSFNGTAQLLHGIFGYRVQVN